ncbi:MAG TPA: cupin domain-containing protein [Bryobacteraceae bacterium]|nr:cupin domain-containing protein [Bryobacteraceae bacterium]
MADAQYWIAHLGLKPHPEGGFFRETYRSEVVIPESALLPTSRGSRSASTAIYFLLAGGDFSALHRLAGDEVWHFYAGATLLVHSIDSNGNHSVIRLGQNAEANEQLQCVVPGRYWFGACLEWPDAYALVGCTVTPGFDFSDFEMARRADLLAQYPQHSDVIYKLTRA